MNWPKQNSPKWTVGTSQGVLSKGDSMVQSSRERVPRILPHMLPNRQPLLRSQSGPGTALSTRMAPSPSSALSDSVGHHRATCARGQGCWKKGSHAHGTWPHVVTNMLVRSMEQCYTFGGGSFLVVFEAPGPSNVHVWISRAVV